MKKDRRHHSVTGTPEMMRMLWASRKRGGSGGMGSHVRCKGEANRKS